MEYEFENQTDKFSSSTSSASSSTSESFINQINNLKSKMSSKPALQLQAASAGVANSLNTSNNELFNQHLSNPSMASSCSLIFSTAASFNLNQNDAVFYSRESIHLLAKFLANNSEQTIFRSLYSYAPDNLAWLWSFLDWDTPVDLSQVPVQEHYEPFDWCLQEAALSQTDDELINRINKIFSDSPLIQYKYRENLMIADLYKFLEHLQKINLKYIAISLFNLYFPRFSMFMDDQIKPYLRPKILASNLPLIKELDQMIVRLIKSRYSNINEYKHKLITNNGLPSYVRSLLNESSVSKVLAQSLASSVSSKYRAQSQAQMSSLPTPAQTPKIHSQLNNDLAVSQDEKNFYQTLSYLKLLEKSTKLNNDLDHAEEELNNQDDDAQEREELKNILINSEIVSPRTNLVDQSYYMNFTNFDEGLNINNNNSNNNNNNHYQTRQQQQQDYLRSANLLISSPRQHHQSSFTPNLSQNIANKILINTPQTPSNLSPYLLDKLDSSALWSNSANQRQFENKQRYLSATTSVTPPPSACKLDLNNEDQFAVMSPLGNTQMDPMLLTPGNQYYNDEQLSKYFKSSAIISSPVSRLQQHQQKINDYSNFAGTANLLNPNQHSSGLIGNLSNHAQSAKYFNDLSIKTSNHQNNYHGNNARSPLAGTRSPVYSNQMANTHHTWCGRLPPKVYSVNSLFSRKVFLGGLPWDVNQQYLLQLLHKYGTVKLEIPGKDLKHPRVSSMNKMQERSTPGYVYIIFDHESAVQRMLTDCRKEYKNGGEHYYYNIFIPPGYNPSGFQQSGYGNNHGGFIKRGKSKEVEVIPWNQDDTSFVPLKLKDLPPKIDPKSTIFVGALHGMLNAQGLGKVMTEIFGEVIHAGLDTDKYKYPIGSGRVTFRDRQSYVKAINAKYVTIKANLDPSDPSPKFEKTIQIDPYLEDAKCSKCDVKSYYFCRNESCLDYYCMHCWNFRHESNVNGEHVPLSRQNKPSHG